MQCMLGIGHTRLRYGDPNYMNALFYTIYKYIFLCFEENLDSIAE